jgi:hypothetical protein
MKSSHKGLLVALVVCAGGLTVWSAAAGREERAASEPAATVAEEVPAAERGPVGQGLTAVDRTPDTAPAAAHNPSSEPASPAVSEGEPVAAPADLKITSTATRLGRVWKVRRQGHLVAVRLGGKVHAALHEVALPAGTPAQDLVWETTSTKTLETLRGHIVAGAEGSAAVENTVRVATLSEEARRSHLCRGHADGAGGFVVVCRVEAGAAAASADGGDPRQGVWSLAGMSPMGEISTLVRLDLPMSGDGATAKVLGYEKGGKGVVVRAEASRAPGEAAAVLAIGSDSRSQPSPPRRIGCFSCRLPPRDDLL